MIHRKSKQRERIYKLLKNTDVHPSAGWIHKELRKTYRRLSLGTVYRNLKVLTEQGFIKRLDFGNGTDRFECTKKAHDHLICENCGRVLDIELKESGYSYNELEKITGFSLKSHRTNFFGLCGRCKKSNQ